MPSLRDLVHDFAGAVAIATTDAPDSYPDWLPTNWKGHRADLLKLWAQIRPRLKHDCDKAKLLDDQLTTMIAAFDAGNKGLGSRIAWDIHNSQPSKLH